MVSWRNFFSICVMMATVLMLFQFSIAGRDLLNNYNENVFISESEHSSEDAWSEASAEGSCETVVYIGDEQSAEAGIIRQWCEYTKRRFDVRPSLSGFSYPVKDKPTLICLSEGAVDSATRANELSIAVSGGQNILFCDVSDVSRLTELPRLQEILGIRGIASQETELTGINLYPGFMLGGEAIYTVEDEEDKLNRPVSMSAPWYLRTSGTKCYMAGTLEDEEIENEDLPALIWRNTYGKGHVFAVNGPYMQDETGLGVLSAAVYEASGYALYPVVNAQNLSVADFPVFSEENPAEMTALYARSFSSVQSSLIWPNLILAANRSKYKMTNFLTPRLDYSSGEEASPEELTFYLKQFREQDAEAGISADRLPGTELEEKLATDKDFFDSADIYTYGAAYVNDGDLDAFLSANRRRYLKNIRTVTGVWENRSLLFYGDGDVTAQGITADGFEHPYQQDLRVRAIETALGYSNILLNMKYVPWPEADKHHWEILSESFSSCINTYWQPFSTFEKTTISQSDERVREFFAVSYADSREGDEITLSLENTDGGWFILRTHEEEIAELTGGEYTALEEDAYLIHATEKTVKIKLKERQKKLYFLQQR